MGTVLKQLRPAIALSLALWVLCGLVYPLVMTGISQLAFPYQANGSPMYAGGRLVASGHVGQYYNNTNEYFWSRPSATLSVRTGKPEPYNAFNSGPSNLGPTNAALIQHIQERIRAWEKRNPGLSVSQIPLSMLESSGSGLDPDIPVQGALIQIPRVARYTGLSRGYLQSLVRQATHGPQWGVFGRRRVNVVQLNVLLYSALHR